MTKTALDNSPLEADVREAFGAILACDGELASERGSYMQRCKTIRNRIADIYDGAKQKGITRKVLKAAVKEHELRRKAEACRGDLEADEQHEYDMLCEKLGDLAGLPLGEAAMSRHSAASGAQADRAKGGSKAKPKTALDSLTQ